MNINDTDKKTTPGATAPQGINGNLAVIGTDKY
jgi:hypothetical protein